MVLLNKWDLVEKDSSTAKGYITEVKDRLKFMPFVPIWTVSALKGRRIFRIFDHTRALYEQYTTRVGTGRLNRIIQDIVRQNEPSVYRGRRIKFYYATQTYTAPPTFVCFANYPEGIHFSYKRYVINRLRETLGLDKTPLHLIFRKRGKK
jgi:GTP-binding protein